MSIRLQCKAYLEKLIHLLETETALLRNGDFGSLEAYSAAKLSGIKALDQLLGQLVTEDDKSMLEPLISRLNRISNENGVLLKSIYNGSRAAQERLRSLQQAESEAGVYGRKGEALSLPEAYVTSEKSV